MTTSPIVRISKGHFTPERRAEVQRLIDASSTPLVPVLRRLRGLLYYHAAVDAETNTVVNVSIWEDDAAAKQMDSLPEMLAQRPVLENAGVRFDRIANYVARWTIEAKGLWPPDLSN